MTDRQPSEVTNLDRYGHSVLPWSRPHDLLSSGPNGPLTGSSSARCARTGARMSPGSARSGTTATCISPAGFTSGPGTRKARNLASNPACTIAVKFSGLDLTLEGEAAKVTDPAILDRVASIYRDIGWPVRCLLRPKTDQSARLCIVLATCKGCRRLAVGAVAELDEPRIRDERPRPAPAR